MLWKKGVSSIECIGVWKVLPVRRQKLPLCRVSKLHTQKIDRKLLHSMFYVMDSTDASTSTSTHPWGTQAAETGSCM